MKKIIIALLILFISTMPIMAQKNIKLKSDFPVLKGPYLGQKSPGLVPEIFAPGIISTEHHEFSCTFSPDGMEFYFTRRVPKLDRNRIMVTINENDAWIIPKIAPKAGDYEGMEPYITPDGKKFFFQSWRPVKGESQLTMDIWVMNNAGKGLEEPIHMGHPFNPMSSMYFSMSQKGILFTTGISDGMENGKIVHTTLKGEHYVDFKEISPLINSSGKESYPSVALNESYILFTRRNDNGRSSIYVSFKQYDDKWGIPKEVELGLINVSMPYLSYDGKYLFFTSLKERLKGDIYWVDIKIIEEL